MERTPEKQKDMKAVLALAKSLGRVTAYEVRVLFMWSDNKAQSVLRALREEQMIDESHNFRDPLNRGGRETTVYKPVDA